LPRASLRLYRPQTMILLLCLLHSWDDRFASLFTEMGSH
jgi:hypothetical protein